MNRLQQLITEWERESGQPVRSATEPQMPITDLNEAVEAIHALIHAIDTS